MFKTSFLTQETQDNNKAFSSIKISKIAKTQLPTMQKVDNPIFNTFTFTKGSLELPTVNTVYNLEFVELNTDLILPKSPKPDDWVVIYYDNMVIIDQVSFDTKTPIKIYGNRNRIMGLDEALICDMPFMALRFQYVDLALGWILS